MVVAITGCIATIAANAKAFEGKIESVATQGSETTALLYTVAANFLRLEVTSSNARNSIDIVDLKSGALTLLFPHNRSFLRLKPGNEDASAKVPGKPAMPTLPPGVGPQLQPSKVPQTPSTLLGTPPVPTPPGNLPPGLGPQARPGGTSFGAPTTPQMPMPPTEKIELKPTRKTEKILGLACDQYEIKARGETMEIWATDQLLPYQPYVRNQPSRFGPRMIEEQWPGLLTSRRLFPLRVSLRFEKGAERFRFEVKSIKPEKITDQDGKLFQPPPDYHEIEPLPF